MDEHILKVTVLGRKLSVRTDATPEEFSQTIKLLEEKAEILRKSSLVTDNTTLSILLNLILVDDLRKITAELNSLRRNELVESEKADQITSELIKLISDQIDQ
ncbi:MAG: cell division protein ZapA [Spirochaetia bacterium]|nr:cell division protein ZapA [Spirochaetia bacterium]